MIIKQKLYLQIDLKFLLRIDEKDEGEYNFF